MNDLFASDSDAPRPLAERMRPRCLDDMVGHQNLLHSDAALRRAIVAGQMHSFILWGPPGCGKTTLSLLCAHAVKADFHMLSAVMSGIADIRKVVTTAKAHHVQGRQTVLFVDEVHRFNKAQQDAFLPFIESGTIVFIGATTENPSFSLNAALLSRCRVYVMHPLCQADIVLALQRALADSVHGLAGSTLVLQQSDLEHIAHAADGDVRRALTFLEILDQFAAKTDGKISQQQLDQVLSSQQRRFDRRGDLFYDHISALHKCVRSSNPDAALYWLVCMLEAGCDRAYIARRLTRIAIEDIGLADPRAQSMALDAWQIYERLGSPEGELAFAQLVLYLACAAKSNAGYVALKKAQEDIGRSGSLPVPLHLRNAVTSLDKHIGYGQGYVYDHDLEEGVALLQAGFPESMGEQSYYQPVERGLEIKIKEKLDRLRCARTLKKNTHNQKS